MPAFKVSNGAEFRRFAARGVELVTLDWVWQRLAPNATKQLFKLGWTDDDGDLVTIANDRDLNEAIEASGDSSVRLKLIPSVPPSVTAAAVAPSLAQHGQPNARNHAEHASLERDALVNENALNVSSREHPTQTLPWQTAETSNQLKQEQEQQPSSTSNQLKQEQQPSSGCRSRGLDRGCATRKTYACAIILPTFMIFGLCTTLKIWLLHVISRWTYNTLPPRTRTRVAALAEERVNLLGELVQHPPFLATLATALWLFLGAFWTVIILMFGVCLTFSLDGIAWGHSLRAGYRDFSCATTTRLLRLVRHDAQSPRSPQPSQSSQPSQPSQPLQPHQGPQPHQVPQPQQPPPQSPRSSMPHDGRKGTSSTARWGPELAALQSMGFAQNEAVLALLDRFNGGVDAVVTQLLVQ